MLTFLTGELILRVGLLRSDREEFFVDEELLWLNRPGQRIRLEPTDEQASRAVTVDERGFRTTIGAKSGRGRRVLVLGDSAMFGSLLDDHETFSSQLQWLAGEQLEVINAGVGGWGLFQEEMLLRREIERLRPDIVLVNQQSLDAVRQPFPENEPAVKESFLRQSRMIYALRRYSKLGNLMAHLARKVILGRTNRGVVNEVTSISVGRGQGPSPAFVNCCKRDTERLIAMKAVADRHGAILGVLVGGPRDHVAQARDDANIAFFLDEMAASCRANGIFEVDLTPRARDYDLKTLTLYPVDGHPSPLWNRMLAEETYRTLQLAGLLGETRRVSDGR
jgi:hypothetical protein